MKKITRPGLAVASEVLGYVIGGLCVLSAIAAGSSGGELCFAVGGGIVAMSILMRKGLNWSRVTFTVLIGLFTLMILAELGDDSTTDDECALGVVLLAMPICAIVFSWVPKVNLWFREMAKQQESLLSTPQIGQIICKSCGAAVSCDSRFCMKCGAPVDARA